MMMDRRIVVFGSVGTLLFLLVAFIRPFPPTSEAIDRWFWANKFYGSSVHDVVVFGNSRIYRGFATPVADSMLGTSTLNYGFSSACATPEILHSVDERVADNGTVVIGVSPFLLFERERISNRQYKMIRNLEYQSVLRRLYLDRYIWRFTDPIVPTKMLDMARGKRAGLYETMNASGYCATTSYPIDSSRANASYIKRIREQPVLGDHLPDLIHQISVWEKRGIVVFAVQPPISQSIAAIEDTLGKFDVNDVRKRLVDAGAIWVDLPRTGYITYDGSHLDASAAELWTRQLTDSIIALHPKKRRR